MNKNIKICFMGTPEFGKIVLEKLIEEFDVRLVVTQPDKKGKRGSDLIESPVKKLAILKSIDLFQPENIKEDYLKIKEAGVDFIVTAAYGQFIPLDVLHLPKFMTLNVHGSDLPKYRGGAPIQRAIENGDEYLGVSIMRTILKMDAGVVFKKALIKNEENDTTGSMVLKLASKGALLLTQVIEDLYEGKELPLMHQKIDEVTFAKNINKEEEILDFNLPSLTLFNKIKAFNPDPITYFKHKNQNYKVYESKVVKCEKNVPIGTILDNNQELIIRCAIDAISIKTIQSPGKKVMPIKDFLNGKRKDFLIGDIIN